MQGFCHKTKGGTAYNFVVMKGDYLTRCQNTMRQKYGESVHILITQKGDPATYPNGAWFDRFVQSPMQVTGIDEDKKLYILRDGKSVPFSCAELLTWTPPVFRSDDLVTLVEELYHTKRQPSRQEILSLLRLAFSTLPDDAELIISQDDPFILDDETIVSLEEHRYQVGDYMVLFVAGVHKVYVVALDKGMGNCIKLTRAAFRQ